MKLRSPLCHYNKKKQNILNTDNDTFIQLLLETFDVDDDDDVEILFSAAGEGVKATISDEFNKYVRNRLEWEKYVIELEKEGPNAFSRLHRMQKSSFDKLHMILDPVLGVDESLSRPCLFLGVFHTFYGKTAVYCLKLFGK